MMAVAALRGKGRFRRNATAAKTAAIPNWQNQTHHNSLEAPGVSAKRGLGHSVSSFGRISVPGCAWDGWTAPLGLVHRMALWGC
ncbi:hypothetical protein DPV78_007284 [Talaromyces pinophilus]|nr:hypothetical protein DPV78_007284 [Talaromyces pinophilus]